MVVKTLREIIPALLRRGRAAESGQGVGDPLDQLGKQS